jgi:hypothetical protein
MRTIQIIGIVLSVAILLYAVSRYRGGRSKRIELIAGILIALGLGVESAYPEMGDFLTGVLMMRNRFLAVMLLAVLLLFALFFYLLNQLGALREQMGLLVRGLAKDRLTQPDSRGEAGGDVAVIIPAYNEEATIERVLGDLPKEVCGRSLYAVVVVDGARDGTERVVHRSRVPVASHIINRGQGDALRTGFEIAAEKGAQIVVTMDADGQHLPEELARLIGPVAGDEADFVLGSRFLGSYDDRGGARHAGIWLFTRLLNLLAGTRLTDITNGYRAIRTRELARLDLQESRFSAPELIMEAAAKGLRIREVPVTIRSRGHGESKKPRGLGYPVGFGWAILRCWLRSVRPASGGRGAASHERRRGGKGHAP